jgi:hypothetical protein
MILSNPERNLFSLLDGFLNSFIPQYIDSGSAIIPAQVIKVPRGIELSSSNAIINNEEPVTKSVIVKKVTIKELKNQIFLLFIFIIVANGYIYPNMQKICFIHTNSWYNHPNRDILRNITYIRTIKSYTHKVLNDFLQFLKIKRCARAMLKTYKSGLLLFFSSPHQQLKEIHILKNQKPQIKPTILNDISPDKAIAYQYRIKLLLFRITIL